ncbi:MAG: GAF domain-containing protein [Myxococcales bacterium]|nr:GAF domain-containing protein [Myxococcales bacterium]
MLLRSRKRRDHWLFALFTGAVSVWYLTAFLTNVLGESPWARLNVAVGVLLPLAAMELFRTFIPEEPPRLRAVRRVAIVSAGLLLATTATQLYGHLAVRALLLTYVSVLLLASLAMLRGRARRATSKFEAARLVFLTVVGGLAAAFTLLEYLPLLGLELPPVGTILVLVFLYMLYQAVLRYRLLDLYELAFRLGILTLLSFVLAGLLWLLVTLGGERYFLHAVVASLVVLVLFDPLRARVREKLGQLLFRERFDLERHVLALRRQVAHALDPRQLGPLLVDGLESSRRVTHVSLYLAEEGRRHYELATHLGPEPPRRLEMAPAGPLLERLRRDGFLVLENVERALHEQRELGEDREAETLYEIAQSMDAIHGSLVLALSSADGDLYGLLSIRDERMRDAFSPEEVQLLAGLAAQAAIALENSRAYQRLKERDRLAALGEMAAGLAHEIRNPLGAIKASAQLLVDEADESDAEFLAIIVEETDRLNRVVGSFLDYARPARGNPAPTDVSAAIERTLQLLRPECQRTGTELVAELEEGLPPVRIDAEQLRQVVLNLVQNALQALGEGGEIHVATSVVDRGKREVPWVEVRVHDTGPGIPDDVLKNLFVPFVTTKDRGTGLGLAISQRIVAAAGGRILVRTREGEGATFVVRLPASDGRTSSPSVVPSVKAQRSAAASTESSTSPSPSPSELGGGAERAGANDAPSDVVTSR